MFLAIINDTYSEVKEELSSQKDDLHITDLFKQVRLNKYITQHRFDLLKKKKKQAKYILLISDRDEAEIQKGQDLRCSKGLRWVKRLGV